MTHTIPVSMLGAFGYVGPSLLTVIEFVDAISRSEQQEHIPFRRRREPSP